MASLNGVNVIGHLRANTGLGVHGRQVLDSLLGKHIRVDLFDVDGRRVSDERSAVQDHRTVDSDSGLRHHINVYVLEPQALFHFLAEHHAFCFAPNRFNAAIAMWELPLLPAHWRSGFASLDAVLAASDFVQGTYVAHLSGTAIIRAPCPLQLPAGVAADRARFGMDEGVPTFVSSFDPNSDPQRKNPFAVVRAFIQAFGDSPQAALVIKANNPSRQGVPHPGLTQLRKLCDGRRNIRVIDEVLSYADTLSLYASADVFVSLHRAEGLGLALMEAMALGKPVIATAWSGNMSFMDATSACLVGYRLVPVRSELPAYAVLNGKAHWAEPSEAEAAAWMRELARDPAQRQRIGQAAQAAMAAYQRQAQSAHFIDELGALVEQRGFLPARAPAKADDLWRAAQLRPPSRAQVWAQRWQQRWQQHVGWRLGQS